mgnify:CR=1 FL=1
MWLRAGRGGRGRALGPDHEQDAGGAEICCRPDRRPGMTQDLAGAAPLYREALEARRVVLGDRHPETLTLLDSINTLHEASRG